MYDRLLRGEALPRGGEKRSTGQIQCRSRGDATEAAEDGNAMNVTMLATPDEKMAAGI